MSNSVGTTTYELLPCYFGVVQADKEDQVVSASPFDARGDF